MIELVAILVTIGMIYLTSLYVQPVSGIKRVDDFIVYVKSQQPQMANAAIMVGIIVLFSQYFQDYLEQQTQVL